MSGIGDLKTKTLPHANDRGTLTAAWNGLREAHSKLVQTPPSKQSADVLNALRKRSLDLARGYIGALKALDR
jgi:hypothetical protein